MLFWIMNHECHGDCFESMMNAGAVQARGQGTIIVFLFFVFIRSACIATADLLLIVIAMQAQQTSNAHSVTAEPKSTLSSQESVGRHFSMNVCQTQLGTKAAAVSGCSLLLLWLCSHYVVDAIRPHFSLRTTFGLKGGRAVSAL